MLDTTTVDGSISTAAFDLPDWAPRTLREAQDAWEDLRERNLGIRKRFQDTHPKGVLLRSAAMREAWQS